MATRRPRITWGVGGFHQLTPLKFTKSACHLSPLCHLVALWCMDLSPIMDGLISHALGAGELLLLSGTC